MKIKKRGIRHKAENINKERVERKMLKAEMKIERERWYRFQEKRRRKRGWGTRKIIGGGGNCFELAELQLENINLPLLSSPKKA